MQISWYIWLLTNEFLQLFLVKSRGSAIAKIIGHNVVKHSEQFETQVSMWVFEELIDGRKLTEIINETHENVKYLPKHILPENVVSKKKYLLLTVDSESWCLFSFFRLLYPMLLKLQKMLIFWYLLYLINLSQNFVISLLEKSKQLPLDYP